MPVKYHSVFEFGYLCTDANVGERLGYTVISVSDFEYLEKRCLSESCADFSQIIQLRIKHGCKLLQVQNYAGVIFVPSGSHIEVLPKTGKNVVQDKETLIAARKTLIAMLQALNGFRHLSLDRVGTETLKMPLLEIFISEFLRGVNHVVKYGLRSDYIRREDNVFAKKGKLQIGKQLRHNTFRQHKFYCEYDEYLHDRPINRVLKTALLKVEKYCFQYRNQKLLHELLFAFDEVSVSKNPKSDITFLHVERGMTYYKDALNWAKLIILGLSPTGIKGNIDSPSLLFPMESLFEAYVEKMLRKQLKDGYVLRSQSSQKRLVSYKAGDHNKGMFTLKPDLMVESDNCQPLCVLDTKWKLIDAKDSINRFGLSQSDFYQMFAYGQKYLGGKGVLALIYPATQMFSAPLEGYFEFTSELRLWVLPFHINTHGRLGLDTPAGNDFFFLKQTTNL
ncbi:McrC family protein [Grimontia hollisae]|uniref:5-methylcytosine-specific restriction enzyme subunit McrC n=1 Tax=Grimontia hollisae TaxID=673 RepID=A0A377HM75_GRIHO|nr:McrC family protein [Grimontia hollisae]STO57351.1 5-methylcytosine-specific restriction enzyme subunit McrC [Grimontia hollisae]